MAESCGRPATFTLGTANDGPPLWEQALDACEDAYRELGDDPFAAAKISVAGRVVRVEMELAPTRAAAILLRLMQR